MLHRLKLRVIVNYDKMEYCKTIPVGNGISRTVYKHPSDPRKVVKIEEAGYFQNLNEWLLWQQWKSQPALSRWLAPCYEISADGRRLVMEYVHDLEPWKPITEIPNWLREPQKENFGYMGKKIVCRDYGYLIKRLQLSVDNI